MVYDDGIIMKHKDFGRDYGVRFIGTKGILDVSRSFLDSNPAGIAQTIIPPNDIHLYDSTDHQSDWLEAIKKNTAPICDAETGHRTSTVCCLANIAYWLNRPLEWDPVKEKFIKDREADKLLKASLRDPWNWFKAHKATWLLPNCKKRTRTLEPRSVLLITNVSNMQAHGGDLLLHVTITR